LMPRLPSDGYGALESARAANAACRNDNARRKEKTMQDTLYVFCLSTVADEFTVTTDRTGANLPRGEHISGTWRFVAEVPASQIAGSHLA